MKTPADRLADRNDPRFAKPENFDVMVAAAAAAARAARAAGANYDAVRESAKYAAFQVAGLRPSDDPWAERLDLD